jgi:hypothetical protein
MGTSASVDLQKGRSGEGKAVLGVLWPPMGPLFRG